MDHTPCHLHQKMRGPGGLGPAAAFAEPCTRCKSYIHDLEQGTGDWNALKLRFYAALSRTARLAPREVETYAQSLAMPNLLESLRACFQQVAAYIEKHSDRLVGKLRGYLAIALLELEGENWYEADATLDEARRLTVY